MGISGLPRALARTVRAGQWWDYKLVPILTVFYATAFWLGTPIWAHWQEAMTLFLALLPGAAFVSIVNDITDLADDAAAGKPNRMAQRSPEIRAAALAATLAGGALFFWLWRDELLLLVLYGAAWIAFACYSIPPVRLKARGLAGLFADAAGAHLFPALLAGAVALSGAGHSPDPIWLAPLAIWAFSLGCRGIVWHQLLDRDLDRRTGTATYAAGRSTREAARFASIAFAVECAALLVLLALLANPLPLLALFGHILLTRRRARIWAVRTVIAVPGTDYRLWLDEFYGAMLPTAILLASALVNPEDLIVLAVHLLLFPKRPFGTVRDGWILVIVPLFNRLARQRPMDRRG